MVLTLSIMLIIVAFSLYDYFSSKSWQMVTSKERNETVFENRNKEYGAYQIRKDYDKRILLIFLGFTVGVGALWGASNLFKPLEQKKPTEIDMHTWTADLSNTDEKEPEIPEPEVEKPAAPTKADIAEFRVMEISDKDQDKDLTPPDPNKNIGTEKQEGDPGTDFDLSKLTKEKGAGEGTIEKKKDDDDGIAKVVDEQAQFPGGLAALRQYIADNIDLTMIDGSSKISLKFVVDLQGEISAVVVTRNSEECESCEKAAIKVVKGMPKWKPAKVNGEPVKSYYRLPINIQ